MTEICKCGHGKIGHHDVSLDEMCLHVDCKCKKFESSVPQNLVQNHGTNSQQVCDAKNERKLDKAKVDSRQNQSNPVDTFNLSSKIERTEVNGTQFEFIPTEKVREFVKIVDKDFFTMWIDNNGKIFTLNEIRAVINRRAGRELT